MQCVSLKRTRCSVSPQHLLQVRRLWAIQYSSCSKIVKIEDIGNTDDDKGLGTVVLVSHPRFLGDGANEYLCARYRVSATNTAESVRTVSAREYWKAKTHTSYFKTWNLTEYKEKKNARVQESCDSVCPHIWSKDADQVLCLTSGQAGKEVQALPL